MNRSLLFSTLASLSLLLASNAFADHRAPHYQKHHDKHHQKVVYVQTTYARPAYQASYAQTDYARVIDARPIYRSVAVEIPEDNCQVERVAYSERRGGDSFQGTLVGGLIGAAIGHELGNGHGRATAAGGLLGAAIGNNVAGNRVTRYEDRQVCSTAYRTEYQRELVAYDVSYSYLGRVYHTETQRHPGDRIAVDVAVRPR
jgi:uncharacterized protein YcfJ